MVDGSAYISCNSNNYATVEFVMYDDYGNKVWGEWSGTLEYVDASTKGSSALKANSTLPSKEAKPMQLQKRKEEANAPVKRYTQQTAKRTPLMESLRRNLAR